MFRTELSRLTRSLFLTFYYDYEIRFWHNVFVSCRFSVFPNTDVSTKRT
jgi:hypothetical protein